LRSRRRSSSAAASDFFNRIGPRLAPTPKAVRGQPHTDGEQVVINTMQAHLKVRNIQATRASR
jgi:hypothetical protein